MQKADRIIAGGAILTMDPAQPHAEAVAIAQGRILAVGSRAAMEGLVGAHTTFDDLDDQVLLPGFVEAHSHPFVSGMAWGEPVLDIRAIHVPTYQAALEKIRRRASKASPGEIIWCVGLDPQLHEGMHEPTREELDAVAPNHAVVVQTANFHALYFNSTALEAMGIDAAYEPPMGGKAVRGSDGRPWKLSETAMWQMCTRFWALCGDARTLRNFDEWVSKFVRAGYTTTSEIQIEPGIARVMQGAIRAQPRRLRIVGYEAVHLGGETSVPVGFGDDDFRVVGTKLHADGSVLLGNVWTSVPYLNNDMTLKGMGLPRDSTGHANLTPEKLHELVDRYVRQGWQMSIHAHGDRTIDMVLDAYERVLQDVPRVAGPLRIEHCGLMREDQIDRAVRLGVACSYFLPYIYYWGEALRDHLLGPEVAARFVPSGSATRKGMRVSYHCDSPMTWPDALACMHVAVTRRTRKGAKIGPEQCVPVEAALKALTIDAAYQLRMDDRIGSIEPGKWADFVVLGRNPLTCDPERLLEIPIVKTIIGGGDVVPG
jgi:predicted amidohydrolase YtcJ